MGHSTSVGDEGGFAPMISDNENALKLIVQSIKKAGFINGKDVSICLDVAANELFKKEKYSIHSKKYISVDQSIQKYLKLIKKQELLRVLLIQHQQLYMLKHMILILNFMNYGKLLIFYLMQ